MIKLNFFLCTRDVLRICDPNPSECVYRTRNTKVCAFNWLKSRLGHSRHDTMIWHPRRGLDITYMYEYIASAIMGAFKGLMLATSKTTRKTKEQSDRK
jgi:hypothetical protein